MPDECPEIPLQSLEAARVAALLGERISLPVLVEVGVDAEELDSLFDLRVLTQEDATYATFTDPSCRDKLVESIPWSFRRKWSLKLAKCLETRKGSDEDLGRLFLSAQLFDRARPYLIRVAESACLQNDYPKALALLRQVFELWDQNDDPSNRTRLLREMARCAANTGDFESAVIAWEELLESARSNGDIVQQIQAHKQLAGWAGTRAGQREARQHLEAAARLASNSGDPDMKAKEWFGYALHLMSTVRLIDGNQALDTAYRASLRGSDVGQRIEIMATRALGQAMIGKSDIAFEWIDEALNLAIKSELPEQVSYVYRRMANVHEYSGNFQGYLDLELKALNRCQSAGHSGLEHACLSCLSYAFFRCGQWKRAQEMLKSALAATELEEELRMVSLASKSAIAALRGERKTAASARDECLNLIRRLGGTYMQFHIYWPAGVLAQLEGNHDKAETEFLSLMDLWRDTDDRHDAVPGLMLASGYFAERNNLGIVGECIDILNRICTDSNNRENRSARDAASAEQEWMKGRITEAIQLASTAINGYNELKMPIEAAFLHRRLGLMYQSNSDSTAAEKHFRQAETIARELGMRPLIDALNSDRKAGPSNQRSGIAAAGLTKRQAEVLNYMGDGLTNKEIAGKLNLSPRTVEMHVGSILERLNCRSRTDAIKKAVELGLV